MKAESPQEIMIFRLIFPVINVIGGFYTIKRLDFNGTDLGDVKRGFTKFICLAVDIIGKNLLSCQIGYFIHTVVIMFLSVSQNKTKVNMSLCVRKPTICLCENKDADQLRGNREADQRLCFRYADSTVPLLLKSKISSL